MMMQPGISAQCRKVWPRAKPCAGVATNETMTGEDAMERLQGKVAVVTGAGSGMGKAMAELFVAEGARVVCADRSGKEGEVAASLGAQAIGVRVDVTSSADVQRMIQTAEERFGRLDVLVNNAGFGGDLMPLADFTEADFDTLVAINLKGVFLGMKYGIQSMLKTGGGAIVNTSSASGVGGWAGLGVYGAAKAGVIQMTKTAALEYAEQGIRVNTIAPGVVWTGMVPASAKHPTPPDGAQTPYDVPLGRWGLAGELAAAALFLASEEASYITGVMLPVDGGFVASAGPAHRLPSAPA
jgi:NAD(P)-dependent dehydrogenase (short-subunit alcohol dehydrogenase family)